MSKAQLKEKSEEIEFPPPGAQLRTAREAMDLSQQEIAIQMKLSLAVISAIDEDDYENLPSSGYVRGYLRSYALLVKLPPDKILESYNKQAAESPALQPYSSQPAQQAHSGDLLVRVATWTIIAVLLALLVMWWQNREEQTLESLVSSLQGKNTEAPVPEEPEVAEENENNLAYQYPIIIHSEPEVSAARELEESIPLIPELTAENTAEVQETTETAGSDEVVVATVEVEETPEEATPAPAPAAEVQTASDTVAQLYVRSPNESWIEILDATGSKLFFNLAAANRELKLEGLPPFKVLIGNSSGVVVKYNDVEQDISNFSNEGVSRFLLGNTGPFRPVETPPTPSE